MLSVAEAYNNLLEALKSKDYNKVKEAFIASTPVRMSFISEPGKCTQEELDLTHLGISACVWLSNEDKKGKK